jgi:hypothetical protein
LPNLPLTPLTLHAHSKRQVAAVAFLKDKKDLIAAASSGELDVVAARLATGENVNLVDPGG